MVNGKMPLYLTLAGVAFSVAAILIVQPYSADFPATTYAKPAQRYVRAALREDSLDLSRMSASLGPVAWALHASRNHRDRLTTWATHTQVWTGERRGDTAEVFVYPDRDPCSNAPIILRFVGSGRNSRVLSASSACLASK
jgi:hypothetical protein